MKVSVFIGEVLATVSDGENMAYPVRIDFIFISVFLSLSVQHVSIVLTLL